MKWGRGGLSSADTDYQYAFSIKVSDKNRNISLILMSPKADFAGNIYKILKEKGDNGVGVNFGSWFPDALESKSYKS